MSSSVNICFIHAAKTFVLHKLIFPSVNMQEEYISYSLLPSCRIFGCELVINVLNEALQMLVNQYHYECEIYDESHM
jgi:hypothetical protein